MHPFRTLNELTQPTCRGLEFSRRAYKLARLALRSPETARRLAPSPRGKVVLDGDFELFFPVFSHTNQLYSLATIPNWRQRCRKAACFINDSLVGNVAGISA